MTNVNLLKSKMIAVGDENFVTVIADLLNCSRTTASRKLHGEIEFSQKEISIFADRYCLSGDEIKNIFIGAE